MSLRVHVDSLLRNSNTNPAFGENPNRAYALAAQKFIVEKYVTDIDFKTCMSEFFPSLNSLYLDIYWRWWLKSLLAWKSNIKKTVETAISSSAFDINNDDQCYKHIFNTACMLIEKQCGNDDMFYDIVFSMVHNFNITRKQQNINPLPPKHKDDIIRKYTSYICKPQCSIIIPYFINTTNKPPFPIVEDMINEKKKSLMELPYDKIYNNIEKLYRNTLFATLDKMNNKLKHSAVTYASMLAFFNSTLEENKQKARIRETPDFRDRFRRDFRESYIPTPTHDYVAVDGWYMRHSSITLANDDAFIDGKFIYYSNDKMSSYNVLTRAWHDISPIEGKFYINKALYDPHVIPLKKMSLQTLAKRSLGTRPAAFPPEAWNKIPDYGGEYDAVRKEPVDARRWRPT